jgi:hypothetical protein
MSAGQSENCHWGRESRQLMFGRGADALVEKICRQHQPISFLDKLEAES